MFTSKIDNYFAQFTPGCFALFCESHGLAMKQDRAGGMDDGFLWAAVRAVHRGDASCAVLSQLTPSKIEESCAKTYRRQSEFTPGHRPATLRWLEMQHGHNSPSACRPHTHGGTLFDPRNTVTVGMILADIFAKFDYRHAVNRPLWEAKIDIRAACSTLLAEGGYVEGDALRQRGIVPSDRRPLYNLACKKAEAVHTWAIRDIHIAAAARDLGWKELDLDVDAIAEWEKTEADINRSTRNHSGFSIVGPKPWTPSACVPLGVQHWPLDW